MPSFRKLNPDDLGTPKQRPLSDRARVAQEYDNCLADFEIGDYGRVELEAGERRAVVRRRLQAAARRRGFLLRFRPGPGEALIFRTEEARAAAPKASAVAKPAPAPQASGRATASAEPKRPAGKRHQKEHEAEKPRGGIIGG